MTRFPVRRIKHGYYTPEYKPVTFAPDIHAMYDYRLKLKTAGEQGEKIIKLALANLYGKFAQNKGVAYYQCRSWAGWITSLVRRLMLEACEGIEDRIISFNQDAIHYLDSAELKPSVAIGTQLGGWKACQYEQGLYIAPGIYELTNHTEDVKAASRGASLQLDFARLATDLSDRGVTELQRQFFVGWAMARSQPIRYGGLSFEIVEILFNPPQSRLEIIPHCLIEHRE